MCGLVGVAGDMTSADVNAFKGLLYLSAWRGIDSTGVGLVPYKADDDPSIIKSIGPSWEFLDLRRVNNALTVDNCAFMGHTRYRTVGAVTKANAQPFDMDNIIGCHNGTLSWGAKGRLEGKQNNFDTDSYALMYRLDMEGLASVMELTDGDDAMALVWFDRKDRTLNMFRNKHRPLHYTYDKAGKTLYWASETAMLYYALNHHKIAFTKIKEVPELSSLTWELPAKKDQQLQKPVLKKFKHGLKPPEKAKGQVFYTNPNGIRVIAEGNLLPFPRATAATTSATEQGVLHTHATVGVPELRNIRMSRLISRSALNGGSYYKSDSGRIYAKGGFEAKMDEGCAVCGEVPVWGEPVKFLKDESILCNGCLIRAVTEPHEAGDTLDLVLAMME